MPNETHPALAHLRSAAMQALETKSLAFRYYRLKRIKRLDEGADLLSSSLFEDIRIMNWQQWAGLAPYVGRPFIYEWQGYIDELGRCITSDAEVVYAYGP